MTAVAAALLFGGSMLERRIEGAAKRAVAVFYSLAVLVFCVFAGIRSAEVGTNVHYYFTPCFDLAQQLGFAVFFKMVLYAHWMPCRK